MAVLCVALILLGGMLSATHTHGRSSVAHADCGLCVVAHTAVQTGTPAPQIFVFQVFTRVGVAPEISVVPAIALDPLFSRPPPADLNRV